MKSYFSADVKGNSISLAYITSIYFCVQYLLKPFVDFLLWGGLFNRSAIIAFFYILFFIIGIVITNGINWKLKNKSAPKSNLKINSRPLYILTILFFTLSFLVKLKTCVFPSINYDCLVWSQKFLKPNFLTLLSINSLLMALVINFLIDQNKEIRQIYIAKIILVLGLFFLWVMFSGVGRSMIMYCLLGLFVNLYYLELLRPKRMVIFLSSIFLVFLSVSAFKSYYTEGQLINIATLYEHLESKIIFRISQAHIIDAIVNGWQKDNYLLFYGWQDFFTSPALGVDRVYLSGSEFGHALNLIGDNDYLTGVGPTYLGDLYMRGGLWMSYIGAIILGVLYRTYDKFIYREPLFKILLLNGILFPFLLHGTEDFVFLTMSTATLIYLFICVTTWYCGLFIKLIDEKL